MAIAPKTIPSNERKNEVFRPPSLFLRPVLFVDSEELLTARGADPGGGR